MKPVSDSVVAPGARYRTDHDPEDEGAFLDDDEVGDRAAEAEQRLERALGMLRDRSDRALAQLRQAGVPMRVVGAALAAGLAAVAVLGAIRTVASRRRARLSRALFGAAEVPARRSLPREIGARILLGAAGVLGARIASEVVVPAVAQRLAAEADATGRRAPRRPRTKRSTARATGGHDRD